MNRNLQFAGDAIGFKSDRLAAKAFFDAQRDIETDESLPSIPDQLKPLLIYLSEPFSGWAHPRGSRHFQRVVVARLWAVLRSIDPALLGWTTFQDARNYYDLPGVSSQVHRLFSLFPQFRTLAPSSANTPAAKRHKSEARRRRLSGERLISEHMRLERRDYWRRVRLCEVAAERRAAALDMEAFDRALGI